MGEYVAIRLWADQAGYVHESLLLPGGQQGQNIGLSLCGSCGVVVGDRVQHDEFHRTKDGTQNV